jgi:hypothetical protein
MIDLERLIDKLPVDYKNTRETWSGYWRLYKTTGSMLASPYFQVSAALSIVLYPWLGCGAPKTTWCDLSLGIFPNLMGFTLGGYAILVSFSDTDFLKKVCGPTKDGKQSPYLKLNALFVHFILMQGLAILSAYIGKAAGLERGIFALFGTWLGLYALLLAFSATLTVLGFAETYDLHISKLTSQNETDEKHQ